MGAIGGGMGLENPKRYKHSQMATHPNHPIYGGKPDAQTEVIIGVDKGSETEPIT